MSTATLKQTTLPVTSKYGPRILNGAKNTHKGTDFPFGRSTPVSAFGAGRVVFAGRSPVYTPGTKKRHPNYERGIYVQIEHAAGIDTSYHSLDRVTVKVGQTVAMGDTIGYGGSSALGATGPHCHVGLWFNGNHVNLENYLTPGVAVTVSNSGSVSSGGATPINNTPSAPAPELIRLDDKMIRIQSPGRGIALIGAGYYRHLSNAEEVNESGAIIEKHLSGNDRQFDIWKTLAVGGDPSFGTTNAIAASTKTVRDDIGYIHEKAPDSLKAVHATVKAGTTAVRNDLGYIHEKSPDSLKAIRAAVEKSGGVVIDSKAVADAVAAVVAGMDLKTTVDYKAIGVAVAEELHRRGAE